MKNILWNIYGRVYDSILLKMIPYQRMMRYAYDALEPRQGGSYFDAGCGTGNLLYLLTDSLEKLNVVGADFSAVMLNRARKKLINRGDRVCLHKLDLNEKLPFENGVFNGITCLNVLYALDDPEAFIKELHRVMDNNGKLVLVTPLNEPKLSPVVKEHIEALRDRYPNGWFMVFLGQIIRTLIPASVFSLVNFVIINNQKYIFFKETEIRSLITASGFKIRFMDLIYGYQTWFLIADKVSGRNI